MNKRIAAIAAAVALAAGVAIGGGAPANAAAFPVVDTITVNCPINQIAYARIYTLQPTGSWVYLSAYKVTNGVQIGSTVGFQHPGGQSYAHPWNTWKYRSTKFVARSYYPFAWTTTCIWAG